MERNSRQALGNRRRAEMLRRVTQHGAQAGKGRLRSLKKGHVAVGHGLLVSSVRFCGLTLGFLEGVNPGQCCLRRHGRSGDSRR